MFSTQEIESCWGWVQRNQGGKLSRRQGF